MSLELSNPPHNEPKEPGQSRRESPLSGSVTTSISNVTTGTPQEDKEYLSSLSQKSSPRLPSILLSPSEHSGTRPRSSEGRVSSLNLPKHPPHPPRQNTANHPSSLGPARRRVPSHTNTNKNDRGLKGLGNGGEQLEDGLLNFGLGDDYALGPEDPEVLADVQRALKAKALREARSKAGSFTASASGSPAKVGPLDARLPQDPSDLVPSPSPAFSVTPPRPTASGSTLMTTPSPAAPARIAFPPYIHSPSRSLESISSEGRLGRSPLPVLISLPDGSSYLDWSGARPEDMLPQKDRSFLGRTFSITRRKGKEKDRHRGAAGRHSVDLGASQGDLHAAQLDNIRRAARRETLSRAETTREELGRRYELLAHRRPTGEPALDILDVVKSRPVKGHANTPWLAWTRQRVVGRQKASVWTITTNFVEDFLERSGQSPMRSSPSISLNIPGARSHSPSHGFSSPFFSSRSSISISPVHTDGARKDRRRTELNRSFSANPVIEGVASTSPPLSPTLSRSLSMTQAPTFMKLATSSTPQPRRSIDAMMGSNSTAITLTNLNRSPRNSLDPGQGPQALSSATKAEKESLRKRVRMSLSGDRFVSTAESRTSTMSSLTNLFNATQTSGAPASSGRRHLGVSHMFGMVRRNGDESGEGRTGLSRSSVSDERESGRDGEGTKSDEPARLGRTGRTRIAPIIDVGGSRSRGKGTPNTSDSDLGGSGGGHLGGKLALRFHRSEKDRDRERRAEDTAEEIRETVSGSEQRLVDSLATPGWTSKSGVRRTRASAPKEIGQEKLQEALRIREEAEERSKEIYKAREVMLIETNDHNRRIARLLKAVGTSIREHELIQVELAQAVGAQYTGMPQEVLDAISADPATTLRHGKGWQAVEDSHHRFITQQAILASYLSTSAAVPEPECSSDLGDLIQEADDLWRGLRAKSEEIDRKCALVKPALRTAVTHMNTIQREYNNTQIWVETDYPEQTRIADLETIITESRSPRGWLEFAAFWIPEHVLEFIGGFIRFFGVPISEKFIRPFLWYFLRDRYYWKIYSTEPPPSERAWYTRLGYWVVILSILAWYTTA